MELGDLSSDRVEGLFRLRYQGDAYVVLTTRVQVWHGAGKSRQPPQADAYGRPIRLACEIRQANPLTLELREPNDTCEDSILAANWPFVVPLELTIRDLILNGIVALVVRCEMVDRAQSPVADATRTCIPIVTATYRRKVDKHAGVTLSFKYDPLASVVVSSTFDKVPSLRQYLQATIEGQLRSVFVEDLPRLVHQTSIRRSAVGRGPRLREKNGSGANLLETGLH